VPAFQRQGFERTKDLLDDPVGCRSAGGDADTPHSGEPFRFEFLLGFHMTGGNAAPLADLCQTLGIAAVLPPDDNDGIHGLRQSLDLGLPFLGRVADGVEHLVMGAGRGNPAAGIFEHLGVLGCLGDQNRPVKDLLFLQGFHRGDHVAALSGTSQQSHHLGMIRIPQYDDVIPFGGMFADDRLHPDNPWAGGIHHRETGGLEARFGVRRHPMRTDQHRAAARFGDGVQHRYPLLSSNSSTWGLWIRGPYV
jgi:hypothetical protein